ncbi:MAG TPA: 4-hydroxy-3-methylbut-2-enyl diphosphate reductase [Anaerolineae bacterium]|nr:4-hydroxy-3-methylbut-2-enyl diphosphate reductase [Anaerolineae bacterium]HQK12379.1 4-hydroxy-3-methylbut-2-enyl diphosphate reductase [Anaerolineae bacterium]
MEIILAKEMGFCFGVKRAIKTVEETAASATAERRVYTLGPIVHNDEVVTRLQGLGVWAKDDLDEIDAGTVIIRAHGVPPETLDAARAKGLCVVDGTCPLVIKVQQLARALHDEGYQVVIYGQPQHPEVIGIVGWAGEGAVVVQNLDDVAALPRRKKIGVVSQTTKIPADYQAIIGALMGKCQELRAHNTICNATAQRQAAAVEVARQVDVMLVIGEAHSSNSRRLAEVCAQVNPRTYRIATADELDAAWVAGAEKVGITAGASTPDTAIEKVIKRLQGIVDFSG